MRKRAAVPESVIASPLGSALGRERPGVLQFANDLFKAIKCPIKILPGDDERRREANNGAVCFLRQHAFRG